MGDSRARFGFSRALRLTRAQQFQAVFAGGRRHPGRFTNVVVRDNGLTVPRLGLAVSRKHLRKAVDRVRLKRLVRESFRHHQATLCGLDVVVLARPGVQSASAAALREDLERHWRRVGSGTLVNQQASREEDERPCR